MKIVLEYDDFSPRNSGLGLLEDLKEHFDGFKVTLFMVPWEIRFGEPTPITMENFQTFCNAVIKGQDWIEIALHGLTHVQSEFKSIGYEDAKKRLMVGEKMLINRGIPYAKIFKAPYWELSKQGKEAAEELGFTVIEDGYYNWNLKDDRPEKVETLITHGHIQNVMGNGLEETSFRVLELPQDTKFEFLSEHLGAKKVYPDTLQFDPVNQKGGENDGQ